MIRARFQANYPDYRPIKWPYPHPYWQSGFAADESHSINIAYADNIEQIKEYWPEAADIDTEEVDHYSFSSRFPKPRWFENK